MSECCCSLPCRTFAVLLSSCLAQGCVADGQRDRRFLSESWAAHRARRSPRSGAPHARERSWAPLSRPRADSNASRHCAGRNRSGIAGAHLTLRRWTSSCWRAQRPGCSPAPARFRETCPNQRVRTWKVRCRSLNLSLGPAALAPPLPSSAFASPVFPPRHSQMSHRFRDDYGCQRPAAPSSLIQPSSRTGRAAPACLSLLPSTPPHPHPSCGLWVVGALVPSAGWQLVTHAVTC